VHFSPWVSMMIFLFTQHDIPFRFLGQNSVCYSQCFSTWYMMAVCNCMRFEILAVVGGLPYCDAIVLVGGYHHFRRRVPGPIPHVTTVLWICLEQFKSDGHRGTDGQVPMLSQAMQDSHVWELIRENNVEKFCATRVKPFSWNQGFFLWWNTLGLILEVLSQKDVTRSGILGLFVHGISLTNLCLWPNFGSLCILELF
jgi:hypothetical protein